MSELEVLDPVAAHWRVDRRIPMATVIGLFGVIVTLIIQTGGAFYWAASVNARLDATDRRVEAIERQSSVIVDQGNKLTAVGVEVTNVKDSIKELKDIVRERNPVTPSQRPTR